MDSALNKKQKEIVLCAIYWTSVATSATPLEHLSALVGKKTLLRIPGFTGKSHSGVVQQQKWADRSLAVSWPFLAGFQLRWQLRWPRAMCNFCLFSFIGEKNQQFYAARTCPAVDMSKIQEINTGNPGNLGRSMSLFHSPPTGQTGNPPTTRFTIFVMIP